MRRVLVFMVMLLATAWTAWAAGPADVPRITVEELKGRLDKGEKIVILDVRSRGSYDSSDIIIKGAVRIPPDELNERASELPLGKKIVAYCT